MSYFENNTIVPIYEEEVPEGQTYRSKFISAGAVGYSDGTYILSQESLDEFAASLKRKPVIIGHQDILDKNDMLEKAVGYVSNVERCPETGDWYADFVVFKDSAISKIDNGELPYVSCAYKADLTNDNLTVNNVKYAKRISGGQMLHLALVKNPRYNGTEIWKNSNDDYLVSEGVLYNQKENVMFGFKKTKIELDKDTLINACGGEMTIEELVNALEEANAKIAEQEEKIKDLEAEKEAAAKPAEVTETVEVPEAEAAAEVQPTVEVSPVEEPEGSDAELKTDLNNSLTEEVKVSVVEVPNVQL